MTDAQRTKDSLTTLDDLKRAIAEKERAWADDNVSDYGAAALRAEAWRTAFEWLAQVVTTDGVRSAVELRDGMCLIREKLK
jgi:hypothetical protein